MKINAFAVIFVATQVVLLVFLGQNVGLFFEGCKSSFKEESVSERQHATESSLVGLDSLSRKHNLPLVPQMSMSKTDDPGARALDDFYKKYVPPNGWIDVNSLLPENAQDMRQLALAIYSGKEIACGYPRPHAKEEVSLSNDTTAKEFCFWRSDFVSDAALDNFSWESLLWSFVVEAFRDLPKHQQSWINQRNDSRFSDVSMLPQLAFLDVGVNIGDYISPIRMELPHVPIYGIEGSPPTAAIATANFLAALEFIRQKDPKTQIAESRLYPFSMTTPIQLDSISQSGGVCFNAPAKFRRWNIGGREVQTGRTNCPAHDIAGASTLAHALLSTQHENLLGVAATPPSPSWPLIFIAKMDIENFEFKAISTVASWLQERPPCFMLIEYRYLPNSIALVELLLEIVGYDTVWLNSKKHDSNVSPREAFWSSARDGVGTFQKKMSNNRGHSDITLGFENLDFCFDRMFSP